jgi:hypothetical protein
MQGTVLSVFSTLCGRQLLITLNNNCAIAIIGRSLTKYEVRCKVTTEILGRKTKITWSVGVMVTLLEIV